MAAAPAGCHQLPVPPPAIPHLATCHVSRVTRAHVSRVTAPLLLVGSVECSTAGPRLCISQDVAARAGACCGAETVQCGTSAHCTPPHHSTPQHHTTTATTMGTSLVTRPLHTTPWSPDTLGLGSQEGMWQLVENVPGPETTTTLVPPNIRQAQAITLCNQSWTC